MTRQEFAFLTLLEQDTVKPLSSDFFDRIEKLRLKAGQVPFEYSLSDDYTHTFEHLDMKYESTINDETTTVYDESEILAFLLAKSVIFANTLCFDDESEDQKLSDYARKSIGLYVNCNDLFFWGCADAIQLTYFDIVDVYEHYMKGEVDVWCCKQRNLMPQKPIADGMRKAGIDIDSYGFETNPTDEIFS